MQQQVGGLTSTAELLNYLKYGEQDRRRNRRLAGMREAAITTYPPINDPAWRWGIDIAGIWDGIIDAAKFKSCGGKWVIVKAADGTITGRYYYENIEAVQTQGIGSGNYNWLYPNNKVSCVNQGKAWAALAKATQPDIVSADYEWTWYGGAQANPNAGDLWIALDTCQQILGYPLWIYSAVGYINEHPLDSRFDINPKWTAQYGVLTPTPIAHFNNFFMWQQSDRWGPAANWGIDPSSAHVSDGDVMTPEKYIIVFGDVTPKPVLNVTKQVFPQSSKVSVTIGHNDSNLWLRPTDYSREHDLDWCVNANSFEYDPLIYDRVYCKGYAASQGKVISGDMNYEPAIAYISVDSKVSWSRPASIHTAVSFNHVLLRNGSIVAGLDNDDVAARTILAWNATDWSPIVINGIEGTDYGATLQRAAEYVKSQGWTEAGNLDGGGSSTAASKGVLVSEPHDDNTATVKERYVSTVLGVKVNEGGFNVKGVARALTNIKTTETGKTPLVTQLQVGQYAYGNLVGSPSTGDLVGFSHIYNAGGAKVELGCVCKAYAGNLALTNETEPVTPPTPPPTEDAMYGNFIFEQTDQSGAVIATYKASGVVMPKQ